MQYTKGDPSRPHYEFVQPSEHPFEEEIRLECLARLGWAVQNGQLVKISESPTGGPAQAEPTDRAGGDSLSHTTIWEPEP